MESAAVPKDVNPIFNFMAVLTVVDAEDRITIGVKDIGVWSSERLGGRLGPQHIAETTLAVGLDFTGFVELKPAKEIAGNGPPVVELVAPA